MNGSGGGPTCNNEMKQGQSVAARGPEAANGCEPVGPNQAVPLPTLSFPRSSLCDSTAAASSSTTATVPPCLLLFSCSLHVRCRSDRASRTSRARRPLSLRFCLLDPPAFSFDLQPLLVPPEPSPARRCARRPVTLSHTTSSTLASRKPSSYTVSKALRPPPPRQ